MKQRNLIDFEVFRCRINRISQTVAAKYDTSKCVDGPRRFIAEEMVSFWKFWCDIAPSWKFELTVHRKLCVLRFTKTVYYC